MDSKKKIGIKLTIKIYIKNTKKRGSVLMSKYGFKYNNYEMVNKKEKRRNQIRDIIINIVMSITVFGIMLFIAKVFFER